MGMCVWLYIHICPCFLVFSLILVFLFKCSVLKFCCMHFSFLLNFFIFKMCICSIYKVLAFSIGSVLVVFFILQLIASVVLIWKSLWIKASAK